MNSDVQQLAIQYRVCNTSSQETLQNLLPEKNKESSICNFEIYLFKLWNLSQKKKGREKERKREKRKENRKANRLTIIIWTLQQVST